MEEILEYTGIMMIDEDENVHISFPDLPGLVVRGETVEGAMNKVVDAFDEFADSEYEQGLRLQDPNEYRLFSLFVKQKGMEAIGTRYKRNA